MRKQDPEDVRQVYREKRIVKSLYGFVASLVGFAVLFWLPAPEWLRHTTGWLIILYGGMYVDDSAVTKWKDLFGGNIPFLGGTDEQD